MTVGELLKQLEGVDLNAQVIVFADHSGHWEAVVAGTAWLRSDEDDYEVDLWHPDDLEGFQKECVEAGEPYVPRAAFVIDGIC